MYELKERNTKTAANPPDQEDMDPHVDSRAHGSYGPNTLCVDAGSSHYDLVYTWLAVADPKLGRWWRAATRSFNVEKKWTHGCCHGIFRHRSKMTFVCSFSFRSLGARKMLCSRSLAAASQVLWIS